MSYDSNRQAGTPSEGILFKNPDDALYHVCELLESYENRLSLGASEKPLFLPERYIDGSLKLLVEARWGSVDFDIVFEREYASELVGRTSIHHERDAVWTGAKKPDVTVWADKHSWDANLFFDLDGCGTYRYDGVVLVDNVQHVQNIERRINSLSRLKTKQEPLGLGANATYFGHPSGFISVGPFINRKPTVSVYLTPVRANKVADEVVKNATEIVDSVSDNGAVVDGHVFRALHAVDILSGFRVYFVGESVKVAVFASNQDRLKILNVAFGPFEF